MTNPEVESECVKLLREVNEFLRGRFYPMIDGQMATDDPIVKMARKVDVFLGEQCDD